MLTFSLFSIMWHKTRNFRAPRRCPWVGQIAFYCYCLVVIWNCAKLIRFHVNICGHQEVFFYLLSLLKHFFSSSLSFHKWCFSCHLEVGSIRVLCHPSNLTAFFCTTLRSSFNWENKFIAESIHFLDLTQHSDDPRKRKLVQFPPHFFLWAVNKFLLNGD